MKLYLNNTSPYARLTLVTAHEAGVAEQLDLIQVDPWAEPAELLAVNPAAKIPALITESGSALIESSCICEYLIGLSDDTTLLPRQGAAALPMLQRLGFGRAAMDCAFGAVVQRRFRGTRSTLEDLWLTALPRTAEALEPLYNRRAEQNHADLGDLTVAIAYAYVDFRLPEIPWRDNAPALADWLDRFSERPSLRDTQPG